MGEADIVPWLKADLSLHVSWDKPPSAPSSKGQGWPLNGEGGGGRGIVVDSCVLIAPEPPPLSAAPPLLPLAPTPPPSVVVARRRRRRWRHWNGVEYAHAYGDGDGVISLHHVIGLDLAKILVGTGKSGAIKPKARQSKHKTTKPWPNFCHPTTGVDLSIASSGAVAAVPMPEVCPLRPSTGSEPPLGVTRACCHHRGDDALLRRRRCTSGTAVAAVMLM